MNKQRETACLVVFEDRPGRGLFRILKCGFRHCYAVTINHRTTVSVDFLKSGLQLEIHRSSNDSYIMAAFAALGASVVKPKILRHSSDRLQLRLMTCVEIVKSLIGVEGLLPTTPHGLFSNLLARVNIKRNN